MFILAQLCFEGRVFGCLGSLSCQDLWQFVLQCFIFSLFVIFSDLLFIWVFCFLLIPLRACTLIIFLSCHPNEKFVSRSKKEVNDMSIKLHSFEYLVGKLFIRIW